VDKDPPFADAGGSCLVNGKCEVFNGEGCYSCPTDCACCGAMLAIAIQGTDNNYEDAAGHPDGTTVTIREGGIIELVLGGDIVPPSIITSHDFDLIGEFFECYEDLFKSGAFHVQNS